MERRLGRGLSSLLSSAPAPTTPASGTQELELRLIRPNPHQPRKTFDSAGLEELRNSIREHGVLQPIVVRRREEGYEIVAGERRWRASRLAGRETIPAVIREEVTDQQMLELALVENVQRNDLDPMEKARGFRALQEELGLTVDQVAERVGLQRATVANQVRLLELAPPVQEALTKGLLSMGHARALLGLRDAAAQVRMLERCVRDELSVRAVEALVREATQGASAASKPAVGAAPVEKPPPWTREIQRRLQEALGTRVKLTADASCRGQVTIDFYQRADLERLMALLAPEREL